MSQRVLFLLLAFIGMALVSCDDDAPQPLFDRPEVSAPSGIINVENGANDVEVSFDVSIDPELTATYTATGIGVVIANSSGTVDSSTIVVTFDASTIPGEASVTLEVTDSEGQTDEASAMLNIAEDPKTVILTSNIVI